MAWASRAKKKKIVSKREKFTVRTEAHRFMHFYSDVHVTFHVYFMYALFRSRFSPFFFARSGLCDDAMEKLFDSFFAHVIVFV